MSASDRRSVEGTTASASSAAELPVAARRVPSTALFGRDREVVILHRGQEYRLRITKTDKLILTK